MEHQQTAGGARDQLVTFKLGAEIYGIDIFKIQEVLNLKKITAIPNAPEFVEGVIDIRDRVIPIVDLKKRLNVSTEENGKRRIVVLDLERPFGVIVDDISKVLHLEASQYEVLPETVVGDHDRNCISRLAKSNDELIIVISPERILSRRESETLREFQKEQNIEDQKTEGNNDAVGLNRGTSH